MSVLLGMEKMLQQRFTVQVNRRRKPPLRFHVERVMWSRKLMSHRSSVHPSIDRSPFQNKQTERLTGSRELTLRGERVSQGAERLEKLGHTGSITFSLFPLISGQIMSVSEASDVFVKQNKNSLREVKA